MDLTPLHAIPDTLMNIFKCLKVLLVPLPPASTLFLAKVSVGTWFTMMCPSEIIDAREGFFPGGAAPGCAGVGFAAFCLQVGFVEGEGEIVFFELGDHPG
jgi:hypothetical protein